MKALLASAAAALCLAWPAVAAAPSPRCAGTSLLLAYDGVLLVKVLDLKIEQRIGEDDYAASARLKTSGILWLFKRVNVTASAAGRFDGDHARPQAFDHLNADGEENRRVKVRWSGAAVSTDAAPAYPTPGDPEPTPAQKLAAADPLTQLIRLAGSEVPCGRSLRFFDGRQLYQLDFGPTAPRAPARREQALGLTTPVGCTLAYREIAGFDTAKQKNQGLDRPLRIEFATLGAGGPWVITALRGKTPLGEAKIELASANRI